jgi:uncharacterized protein (TIGR01244 family)
MNLQQHNKQFSTSAQINITDISELAKLGFKSIINNRPDHEGGTNQPTSLEIEQVCKTQGLHYAYLPVIPSQITIENAKEMAKLLTELPQPILAFCRSGTRSTHLYRISQEL